MGSFWVIYDIVRQRVIGFNAKLVSPDGRGGGNHILRVI